MKYFCELAVGGKDSGSALATAVWKLNAFGVTDTLGIGTTTNHPLVLGVNNAEVARLTAAGLGITGTLSVSGITTFNAAVKFKKDAWHTDTDGTTKFYFESGGGTYLAGTGIQFRNSAGTNLLLIENGGKVGLMTTTPVGWLDLYTSSNQTTTPLLSIRSDFNDIGNYGMIRFGDYTQTTNYQKGGIIIESVSTAARMKMHIALENTDTSASVALTDARVTLLSSGEVGIGTQYPIALLTVGAPAFSANTSGISNGRTFAAATGTGDYGGLYVFSTSAVAADKGGVISLGGYYTGTTDTRFAAIAGLKENGTDGQYGGYFAVYTRTHGAALVERLNIAASGAATFSGDVNVTGTTTFNGLVRFKKDTWHTDADGTVKFLFASGGTTYLRGTGITFRNSSDADKMVLEDDGDWYLSATNRCLWDNGNQRLGLKISAPLSTLHLGGSFGAPYTATITNLTLTEAHYFVVADSNGTSPANGNLTITIPDSANATGRVYWIRRNGTGVVTVTRSGANAFYTTNSATSATSFTVTSVCCVMSDGLGAWHVLVNW